MSARDDTQKAQPSRARDDAADAAEVAAEWVPIETLAPWPNNPRVNDDAVPKVAESIKRFGFGAPIVARRADGEIIAGHTRLKAAQSLGLPKVPVRFVDLDPADAHLLALTDNRAGEFSDWDETKLPDVLSEFSLPDVELAGWSSDDLDRMASELGADDRGDDEDADEQEPPEPPAEPVTRPGDVWRLGDHVLVCGDCRDGAIAEVMGDEQAKLVCTDPPYGVSYVGKTSDAKTIDNDNAQELGELLDDAFGVLVDRTDPGACWYVFAPSGPLGLESALRLYRIGVLRQRMVWVKDVFVLGHSDYHYRHEDLYYGWTPGAAHHEPPDRKQDSVWECARPKSSKEHPTMKPVALIERMLRNSSRRYDIVLDPFAGSGSTLIACERNARRGRMVEISPAYCDVIVERWQNETGGQAQRNRAA